MRMNASGDDNMNCNDASALLPLSRGGELSSDERALLAAHLAECVACASEADSYALLDGRLSLLRDASPTIPNAAGLERAVLEAIRQQSGRSPVPGLLRSLLALADRRALRIGYAMASVALVALALYQQIDTARSIALLEHRLALDAAEAPSRGSAPVVLDRNRFEEAAGASLPGLVAVFGGSVQGNRIEIPRDAAERAAQSVRDNPHWSRLARDTAGASYRTLVLAFIADSHHLTHGG
jgi:hypothetical protein